MSKQNTIAVTTCVWLLILSSQLLLVSSTAIRKRNLQRSFVDKASHSIRKRNVAEAIVQDSVSRGHENHRRRILLHEMLKAVDTSMGGGCGCLWSGDSTGCACDISSLISSLYKILSLSDNQRAPNELIKKALSKLRPHDRRILHTVLRQRLIRIRRMTNRKMMQQRLWAKKRRHRLRQNPRSVFDGKQFFLF